MGKLAYDPVRIDRLRTNMRAVVDLLNTATCDDSAADGAMSTVRLARSSLGSTWLPVLDGIRNCTAMTGYQPVDPSSSDLGDALVWVMHNGYGWPVVTDPLDDVSLTVTPEEARALGRVLQNGDWSHLLDTPAERQRLQEMLTVIAGDPGLSADFFANFDRVDDLANELGHRHFDLSVEAAWYGSATEERAQVDQIIAGLAAAYQSHPGWSHPGPYPTVISDMDPYAAALFLTYLDLPADMIAKAADDISVRTLAWDDERSYPGNGVDTPADIVFRLLIGNASAATAYLQLAADYPQFLVHAADNQALAEQMMLVGMDPRYVSAEEAGTFIVPYTNYVLHDDDWYSGSTRTADGHAPATFLGTLAGPWLTYFTARADDWPWSSDHPGRQMLKEILHDDAAMVLLIQALDGFRDQVMRLPIITSNATLNEEQLEVIAVVLAALRVDLRNEKIGDAAAQRAWVDVVGFFASVALGIGINFTPLGPFAQAATGLLANAGINAAQTWLEDHGVFPPSNETSRAKANADYVADEASTMTAFTVLAIGQLIDEGMLPSDTLDQLGDTNDKRGCGFEQQRERLRNFVYEHVTSPTTRSNLLAVIDKFANPTNVAEAC